MVLPALALLWAVALLELLLRVKPIILPWRKHGLHDSYKKLHNCTLAGVAHWTERRPVK